MNLQFPSCFPFPGRQSQNPPPNPFASFRVYDQHCASRRREIFSWPVCYPDWDVFPTAWFWARAVAPYVCASRSLTGTVNGSDSWIGVERLRVRYRMFRRLKLGCGSCNSIISTGSAAVPTASSASNARSSMSTAVSSSRTATHSMTWSAVQVEEGSGCIRPLTTDLTIRYRRT